MAVQLVVAATHVVSEAVGGSGESEHADLREGEREGRGDARLVGLGELDEVAVGLLLGLVLGERELVRVAECADRQLAQERRRVREGTHNLSDSLR